MPGAGHEGEAASGERLTRTHNENEAEGGRIVSTSAGVKSVRRPSLRKALAAMVAGAALCACAGQAMAQSVAEIAKMTGPQREKALVEGAKKEGKVVIYSSMIVNQALRPMLDAFHAKYPGVATEYYRANSREIINKVLAEARARAVQVDIIEGGGLSQPLIKAGVVQAYSTPALKPYDKELYDPEGYWSATRVSYFGLGYNTKLIAAADVPQSYQDLVKPKYKGKLCWAAKAETGSAMMFITYVRAIMGEQKAEAYLKELAKQDVANLPGSPRTVVNNVMQGECAIAINIFLHHPVISALKGASVAAKALEPVPSNASVALLAASSPHPHAAMLLIDYMLSKEGQDVLQKANYLPAHPDVDPSPKLRSIVPKKAGLKQIFLNEKQLYDARSRSIELQKQDFGSH
jgi:iron(III) transport system substrate-binding protein